MGHAPWSKALEEPLPVLPRIVSGQEWQRGKPSIVELPSLLDWAGRRVCLGEMLAKAELFLFIAQILHQVKIENPPGCPYPSLDWDSGLGLKPKPYKVCMKRTNWAKKLHGSGGTIIILSYAVYGGKIITLWSTFIIEYFYNYYYAA